jgi:hypothetical protein
VNFDNSKLPNAEREGCVSLETPSTKNTQLESWFFLLPKLTIENLWLPLVVNYQSFNERGVVFWVHLVMNGVEISRLWRANCVCSKTTSNSLKRKQFYFKNSNLSTSRKIGRRSIINELRLDCSERIKSWAGICLVNVVVISGVSQCERFWARRITALFQLTMSPHENTLTSRQFNGSSLSKTHLLPLTCQKECASISADVYSTCRMTNKPTI